MNIKCQRCITKLDSTKILCPSCGSLPSIDDSWYERERVISQLGKHTKKLDQKIDDISNKFSFNDQRTQTLGSLRFTTLWATIQLKLFISNFKHENSYVPKLIKSLNPNISNQHILDLIHNYDTMNRSSFLTRFMFETDSFLTSAINTLGQNKKISYKYTISDVLKKLDIRDQNKEKYNILRIPAIVRNCLHRHGVHKDNDYNGRIDGILFKFKKHELPEYSSWTHCSFFCDKIIDVLYEIMSSNRITSMPLDHTNNN